ncbi:multidrug transporter, putative [Babesia ovata]|uniref:Multidrug transporter, putative n=1 Tax=Babesia ovata TaxID=189622 RepID=A0A2H6KIM4_9APIC|nr:multidrug transporter, putative [Babesia ovata]GBE62837.1 multidrug transporter, putative [Babesia ovata]
MIMNFLRLLNRPAKHCPSLLLPRSQTTKMVFKALINFFNCLISIYNLLYIQIQSLINLQLVVGFLSLFLRRSTDFLSVGDPRIQGGNMMKESVICGVNCNNVITNHCRLMTSRSPPGQDDGRQLLRWMTKAASKGLIRGSSRLGEREHSPAAGEQRLDVDEVGGPGEEYDEDVERGDRPECDDGEEEGRTDAIEELGDGLVRQPVERVHLLDGDLQCCAEILAGPLGWVAAGGAGEAVDVPVHEAVPKECGRGTVAVRDGEAVGSVIGARGHGKTLGWAVVGAAVGVAVGRGVGAGALAVLEQCTEDVVKGLGQVHHPGEVEVGVLLGEGGAYVVAEWLEFIWRPWRASEEATQEAAQPGEGRRCAATEGAENVHDASASGGTGGQPGNVGEAHGRLARQAGRRSVTAGALDTGVLGGHVMRQEAHQAILEERLERRLDAALGMLVTALVTYLVACLAGLMRALLVGTLHGVALPTGATDAAAVPAVAPSAVPGVVGAPAVEEIELVVEAFDDVEQQAEQSVGVAGVEEASRVGVEVYGVDASGMAEA